jgi:hypothetical protein
VNRLKQIVNKINKIDFLKTAEIILAVILCVAPLTAAALALPTCGAGGINGVNCSAGTSVTGLIVTVINWMLALAGLIAVLFLIIGGFRYIFAGGNAESAEAGRQTVINAIIGIVIIILSYVIVNVISNLVTNTGGGTSGTGL